jgi:hypothetical protein
MYGDYNLHGRIQTGFDNGFDHQDFGHWRNPEYQEMCQEIEVSEREKSEQNNNNLVNNDDLPF